MDKTYIRIFQGLTLVLTLVLFWGCTPSAVKFADEMYEEAKALKDSGNFNLAKIKLDSVMLLAGNQSEKGQEARKLLAEIEIDEQERNLRFLDSALVEQEALLEPLMKNFTLSDEYGSDKLLIHKRQKPENSYNRTYLRAHLSEDGNFYISSRYHGSRWINHNKIRVYLGSESVNSEEVADNGIDMRRFEDGEFKWEFVYYKDGKDNGIVDFIAANSDKPLRVEFIGKSREYIIMEQYDREAIRDAYEISFILKEIKRIKDEKKKSEELLNKLRPSHF